MKNFMRDLFKKEGEVVIIERAKYSNDCWGRCEVDYEYIVEHCGERIARFNTNPAQLLSSLGVSFKEVSIGNTSNSNIYYKTKCYNDGRLVRQICAEESCGGHPYD